MHISSYNICCKWQSKKPPKHVAGVLIRLGAFFRKICSKAIKPEDMEHLNSEIAEILCQFERIFLQSFFDIMMHLPIHLPSQILLTGPVPCIWMYPVERYLCELKSQVRNRSKPEGSIAEGYLAKECLLFYSRYLDEGLKKNGDDDIKPSQDEFCARFSTQGHPIGGKRKKFGKAFEIPSSMLNQAHRYILFNCQDKEVEMYIE